jgi:hypothetical protein
MPLLNEADEIYIGGDPLPVEQIYIGDALAWVRVFVTLAASRAGLVSSVIADDGNGKTQIL